MEYTTRDPQDKHYGVFNRHYMEYSMFARRDITKALSPVVDYDHYTIELPTMENYVAAMPEPVYFDYTSAVTKSHILSNPHLVPEILSSPHWTKLVDDWDEHYRASLGELPGYVTREIVERRAKSAIRLAEQGDRAMEGKSKL